MPKSRTPFTNAWSRARVPANDGYYPRDWVTWTIERQVAEYDRHNGDSRFSSDPTRRRHGTCGCGMCIGIRRDTLHDLPLNAPLRKGNNSMAGINVCDRCSSLVKGIALGQVSLSTSSDSYTREGINRELCPACVGEILALIETEVPPREVRAFDKPFRRAEEKGKMDTASAEELATALIRKLQSEPKSLNS